MNTVPHWKSERRRGYKNGELEKAYAFIENESLPASTSCRDFVKHRNDVAKRFGIIPQTFRSYIYSRAKGDVSQERIDEGLALPDKKNCVYQLMEISKDTGFCQKIYPLHNSVAARAIHSQSLILQE